MIRFPKFQFPIPNSRAVYEQYRQLSALALKMQTQGLHIDGAAVAKHEKDATARMKRFRALFTQLTGISELGKDGQSKAIRDWFWTTKGLPQVSLHKKKRTPKLDIDALLYYLTDIDDETVNKAAGALIGYRKAAKSLSMLAAYHVRKIHPGWNASGPKGSRWSCNGPNLQQLPSHTVKYDFGNGPEIVAASLKDIIIPAPGMMFVGSDYSALEVYLQAYISGDDLTLEWISKGEDLHINNARIFFGEKEVPLTATKKTHKLFREVGKLGFGFSYCVSESVRTTQKQMNKKIPGITEEWTVAARTRYFSAHPKLPEWQAKSVKQIETNGYGEIGLMKRHLWLEASTRGFNQYMNAQCQTLGGDMVNEAMLKVDANPEFSKDSYLAVTWHDSIIAEVPNDPSRIAECAEIITSAMKGPFKVNGLDAYFVAEADMGPNLLDMIAL